MLVFLFQLTSTALLQTLPQTVPNRTHAERSLPWSSKMVTKYAGCRWLVRRANGAGSKNRRWRKDRRWNRFFSAQLRSSDFSRSRPSQYIPSQTRITASAIPAWLMISFPDWRSIGCNLLPYGTEVQSRNCSLDGSQFPWAGMRNPLRGFQIGATRARVVEQRKLRGL